MYLYVFSHSTYGKPASKIGVSKNPERRKFSQHYTYTLKKTWFFNDRARAFFVENEVCKNFPKRKGRELLNADADDVILFVDSFLSKEALI